LTTGRGGRQGKRPEKKKRSGEGHHKTRKANKQFEAQTGKGAEKETPGETNQGNRERKRAARNAKASR